MMEYHKIADVFPMMSEKELIGLANNIKQNGLQNKIMLCEGKILDGRNRFQACKLAGVTPDYEEYTGDDPLRYIISLNLYRRHLNESQRAVAAAKVANMTQGARTDLHSANLRNVISQSEAADIFNISERNIQNIKAIERDAPEKIVDIESGKKTIHAVEKEIRMATEKNKRVNEILNVEIRKGSFVDILSDVYDIDAIITDPPYPKEYLNCFSQLSKYASEHLKEDGWCIVYSGQYHLPDVITRLSEHLTYVWTFCLYHVGKKQIVNSVNIMCGWKPVLIFSRGRKKMRYSAYDVLISEAMEKHSHEWQQSESGVAGLIEIFTEPGQLVADPFAGSGTFIKVANDMGRNAVGAEIE